MAEQVETGNLLKQLPGHIQDLLSRHECVCIPGLGGFLRREHGATFNRFTGKLLPDHTTVFFNEALRNDDGLAGNLIAEQLKISYNEAAGLLRAGVQQLLESFSDHKQHPFGNLGTFFCNQEGRLFFIPSGSLNLHAAAFGLLDVQAKLVSTGKDNPIPKQAAQAIREEKVTPITAHVVEAKVVEADVPAAVTRFRVWKVAAVLALMTLGGALVLRLSNQFSGQTEQQQAEVIAVTPPPATTSPAPAKPAYKPASEQQVRIAPQTTLSHFDGSWQVNGGLFLSEKTAGFAARAFTEAGYTPKIYKPEKSNLFRLIITTVADEQAAQTLIDSLRTQVPAHYSSESNLLPTDLQVY